MDNFKKKRLFKRYRDLIEKSNFDIETKEKMKNILNEIDYDFLDDNDSKFFFDILREEFNDDDDDDNLEKLINDFKKLNVSNSPRRSIQPVTKEIINNFYKNIEKNRRLSRKRKYSKSRSNSRSNSRSKTAKRRRTLPKTIVDEIGEDELDELYSDVENISINSPYDVLKGKRKRGGSKNKTKKRK
jgi:hypothetical protein